MGVQAGGRTRLCEPRGILSGLHVQLFVLSELALPAALDDRPDSHRRGARGERDCQHILHLLLWRRSNVSVASCIGRVKAGPRPEPAEDIAYLLGDKRLYESDVAG